MKEKGIHDRLLSRMIQDLDRLRSRVERGALVVPAKIERAVGRIQQRYPGLCRWVDVEVRHSDGKTELLWRLKEEMAGEARESEGLYLLRTNMAADSAENVWKGYMTLTRVESVFRSLKQELRLRPVFHLPRHSRTNRRSDWQLCLIENGDKTGQQNAHIELKPAAKLARLG